MRLYMPQRQAFRLQDTATGHDLLTHERADFVGPDRALGASKRFPVRQTRMGSDGHTVSLRDRGRPAHKIRAAGMPTAGDIDRRNERHQCRVERQPFGGVALAHVAVHIKSAEHWKSG
jgi:hypothetical protein